MSIHRHLIGRLREHENGRFANFLRSLLDGVPWSECAENSDEFCLKSPVSECLHIHNPNGRTSVTGSDRDDIEVRVSKRARAESAEAAADLLEPASDESRDRRSRVPGDPVARIRKFDRCALCPHGAASSGPPSELPEGGRRRPVSLCGWPPNEPLQLTGLRLAEIGPW